MSAGPATGLPSAPKTIAPQWVAEPKSEDEEVAKFSLPLVVEPNVVRVPRPRLTLAAGGAELGLLDTADFTEGNGDENHRKRDLGTESESETGDPDRREAPTPRAEPSKSGPNPAPAMRTATRSRFLAIPISGPATTLQPMPSPPRVRAQSAVQPPAETTAKNPTPKRAFQWREEVRDRLELLKRTPDGARIEVEMPEFGTLRLHLYKRPSGRHLRIHVATPDQADLLRAHRGRLKAFLGLEGGGPLVIEISSERRTSQIGTHSPVDQPPRRHGT